MVRRVRVADTSMKILAVKLVREMTGFGLKESLDLVEAKADFEVDHSDARLRSFAEQGRDGGVQFEFDPPLDMSAVESGWSSPPFRVPSETADAHAGEFAVRYRSGPNRINAIKLARELTQLGLAEARDLVDQQGLVAVGVVAREAERIVGLFTEIGSVVEVERNAFVPAPSVPTPSVPAPRAGAANRVYGYSSNDDDF